MSINDPKTKEMISRSLGTHAVETTHESTNRQFGKFGGSRTQSNQTRAQKLVSEDAVNRIGDDTILLLAKDARPIRAKKVKYYKDWRLKKLAAVSAQSENPKGTDSEREKIDLETAVPPLLIAQAQEFLKIVGVAKSSLPAHPA